MNNSIQVTENSMFINGENLWDADLSTFAVDELREFKELARKTGDQELVAAMSVVIAGRIF
jgi:hypothetical protein